MTAGQNSHHDVFVSYAHIDDADGWVTRLVKRLRTAMGQRLGGQPVDIFFDDQLQGGNQLADLLTAARNSTLFVAIGTRAFVQRDWTKRELQAFWDETKDPKRIFVLECLPLMPGMSWPKPIEDHHRQTFFKYDETEKTAAPITLEEDPARYNREVNRLAEELVCQIIKEKGFPCRDPEKARGPGRSAQPKPPQDGLMPGFERKTVLLAQTTEALEDEAEQVRSYLKQFGTRILPEHEYPQGAAEFQAAFLVDLAEADLVVQLLDKRPGRCPPDLPEGYTAYQAAAAREHEVELLQWRHPELDVDAVRPESYRDMLNEKSVVASGLEEFKAMIKERALVPVAVDRPKNNTIVFINADQADLPLAHSIEALCSRYSLVSVLPLFDQKSVSYEDLRDNLVESDAVIYLYGDASPGWVRSQLRFFIKHVGGVSAPKILAVCTGPPREKPDINIKIPGAREIDRRDESFVEEIGQLLAELAQ